MDLPIGKKLPHSIPQWVAEGSWFFITINCVPPAKNQLCRAETGDAMLAAMKSTTSDLSGITAFVCLCRIICSRLLRSRANRNANDCQESEEVRRGKTWRGLATRFFRSPLAQPSRTGGED